MPVVSATLSFRVGPNKRASLLAHASHDPRHPWVPGLRYALTAFLDHVQERGGVSAKASCADLPLPTEGDRDAFCHVSPPVFPHRGPRLHWFADGQPLRDARGIRNGQQTRENPRQGRGPYV